MAKKIVIDAGHGGSDPGASGNGIIEKDLTLKISQYMYNRFRELGIPVAMTRNTDETLNQSTRTSRVLDAFGNSKDVIVISNHINAGGGDGAEVIYALRNNSTLSGKILDELEQAGQNIRKNYQLRLPSNPSKDYYFMLRDTGNTEAIIIEYGFLDSPGDDVDQLKNNYEQFAEAAVKAIADYLNIPYEAPTTNEYYIVQKGDSLWKIANRFGLTVDKLKEINNLVNDNINVGQKLKVSELQATPPSDYLEYKVKAGDSLYKISNQYGVTVEEIKRINNLSSNLLQINQILYIPNITEDVAEKETYTIKAGDNLFSIANKFGVTVDAIKNANGLTSNLLGIGQILIIPTEYIKYTVKAGDSLWKIASQNNTSVDAIKAANNLKSDILNIGQVLKIPYK